MVSVYLIYNKRYNIYRSICKGQYQYNEIGDTKAEAIYNLIHKYGKQIGVEITESFIDKGDAPSHSDYMLDVHNEAKKHESKTNDSFFDVIKSTFNFKKQI